MPETMLNPCPLTELYQILSAPRRCYVIQLLARNDQNEYTVRELSQEIAAFECDIPKEHASGEPYRNVYNALSQTHLRTLADLDIIDYNKRSQCVKQKWNLRPAALLLEQNHIGYLMLKGVITNCRQTPGSKN